MLFRFLLLLVVSLIPLACQAPVATDTAAGARDNSDATAAEESSMQRYWFGMIYKGPNYDQEQSPEEQTALMTAHLGRIHELAVSGEMALAGPFTADPELADPFLGLFLYDVETREEAEALAASDPAVQSGRLRVEIHEWWGVSGLTYPGDPSR